MKEFTRKEMERHSRSVSISEVINGLGVITKTPESIADHIKKHLSEEPLDVQIHILRMVESALKSECEKQMEEKRKELYYLEQQYDKFKI